MKKLIGTLIVVLELALGIIGVLLESLDKLPPPFDYPWVSPLVAAIGFIILALGWQEEFNNGKSSLVKLIRDFFEADQNWKLGLSVFLIVLTEIAKLPILPQGFSLAVQALLAIAATFGYIAAQVAVTVKLKLMRFADVIGQSRTIVNYECL